MREVLPWHEVEARLRAHGVVLDDVPGTVHDEDTPRSGVQSGGRLPAVDASADQEVLSFKVYTLEELERRLGTNPPPVPRPPSGALRAESARAPWAPWLASGAALLAVLYAFKVWLQLGRARPALAGALAAPWAVLRNEVAGALRGVAWKKVGVGLAAGVGVAVALLFAVLTAAELTDDLKPARIGASRAPTSGEDGTASSVANITSAAMPGASAAALAAPAPFAPVLPGVAAPDADGARGTEQVDELDAPRAAPAPARPARAPRPARSSTAVKGKKAVEVFTP